jgi:hypothetical protein
MCFCLFGCGGYGKANSELVTTLHYTSSVYAGSATTAGYQDGPAGGVVRFHDSYGLGLDSLCHLYVADMGNYVVRKVDTNRTVSTFAGMSSGGGAGIYYATASNASAAFLGWPFGLAVRGVGDFFVSDYHNHVINLVSGGMVSTYAGSTSVSAGVGGFQDGFLSNYVGATPGNVGLFDSPMGLSLDSLGNLYVADRFNHSIRKINTAAATPMVITLAGGGPSFQGATNGFGVTASFNFPVHVLVSSLDAQILYVADSLNHLIRKIDMGNGNLVSTFAGGGGGTATGRSDGVGTAALFNQPYALAMDTAGYLFVADSMNHSIRRISPDQTVETLQIDNWNSAIISPNFIVIDSEHNLYVSSDQNQILKLTPVP